MARHQHGIFAEGTTTHHHLELAVHPQVSDAQLVQAVAATRAANADHRTAGGTAMVVGFGPDLWRRLAPGSGVAFGSFPGYASPDGAVTAPTTQRDVWVWVHGPGTDLVLDVVRSVVAAWAGVADVVLDAPGFVYHDSRDLTGFIDGTANPFLDDAPGVALVPAGSPGEAGAFAMTMAFRHDLDAFDALEVAEQEQVVGRAKPDSASLGAAKPADAHIARAEVADADGNELQVYRRSVPWATATDQGLHFVSFGPDLERFDQQLRSMYGLAPDGIVDRLLTYTTARTGSFWFCPSADDLDHVAPLPS